MKKPNFERCDAFVQQFESVAVQMGLPDTDAQFERLREQMREYHAARREAGDGPATFLTGVDLGTACVVLAVLDEHRQPVAGAYQYADVVRDGMVVDYMGAIQLVRTMKERLEEAMDAELYFAAAAIPPGTDTLDGGAVKNVTEAAGFEVTALLDEPSAANKLLGLENGAIIDPLIEELRSEKIGASVHFIPVHLHPYYRERYGYARGDFPVAESTYDRIISLPLYPKMTEEDLGDVVAAVKRIAARHRR